MAELFAMKTPSGQLDPAKLQYPVLVQPKLDGLRGICIKDSRYGEVGCHWYSFTGKPLWNLEHVSKSLPKGDCGVFDGEIIWPGHPFSDAYGLCKRQTQDPETLELSKQLEFHCFDRLELSEWSSKNTFRGFSQRVTKLREVSPADKIGPNLVLMDVLRVPDAESLEAAYQEFLVRGYEGLMAKSMNGLYHWTRHPDWQRYKPTETADVKVIAAYEEEDKHGKPKGTLGGVFVRVPPYEAGPVQHDAVICKVGNGFKAAERKKWWKPDWTIELPLKLPKNMRYGGSPLIGKTIEVEFKCRTASGALREPFFKRLREDKE